MYSVVLTVKSLLLYEPGNVMNRSGNITNGTPRVRTRVLPTSVVVPEVTPRMRTSYQ
jgi:hypothetical protein